MLIVKSLLTGHIFRINDLFLHEASALPQDVARLADTAAAPSRSGVRSKQDDGTKASRPAAIRAA